MAILFCLGLVVAAPAVAEAATLSGTVSEQKVGHLPEALADVEVRVLDEATSETVATGTTDASGQYAMSVPAGTYGIRFKAPPTSDLSETSVRGVDLSTDKRVNAILVPIGAIRLHGVIRTAAGEPVPGLRLYFDSHNPEVAAETGADGSYSVALSPGTYRFVIEFTGPARLGLPPGFWEWDLGSVDLKEDRTADISLPETATLKIHVADKEDLGLPGSSVYAPSFTSQVELGGLGTGTLSGPFGTTAKTDENGDATFTVFDGWEGHGAAVTPPPESGYGVTGFAIPPVTGDTTIVIRFSSTVDTQPPETTITSGPTGPTKISSPTFGFSSSEPGSTFECRFDAEAFRPCSGPGATDTAPAPLAHGSHGFEVRAIDEAGNVDPTSARASFRIVGPPPHPGRP